MFSVVTHTNDIKITMDGIEIKVDNEFYLLDNQGKALKMGEKGLRVAKDSFGIENVGHTFVNFLQSI